VQVRAVLRVELDLVELSWLLEVDITFDLALVVRDIALDLLISKSARPLDNVQLVTVFVRKVLPRSLVSADRQVTVTVEIGDRAERTVDGNLLKIRADAVARSVVVAEQTRLQDWIVAWFPAFDHVGRAEVRLLDFGVVVFRVLGENHAADVVVCNIEPVLGKVQDVVTVIGGFLFGHGGDGDFPGWEVTLFDSVEQVLSRPSVVLTCLLLGLGVGEVADALLGLKLDASVYPASIILDKFVGVAGPAVHVSEAVWRSEVRKKAQELQHRLGELSWPCPECVPITDVRGRVGLLRMDESGKLRGITNEEHRGVYRALVLQSDCVAAIMNILLKTL